CVVLNPAIKACIVLGGVLPKIGEHLVMQVALKAGAPAQDGGFFVPLRSDGSGECDLAIDGPYEAWLGVVQDKGKLKERRAFLGAPIRFEVLPTDVAKAITIPAPTLEAILKALEEADRE